MATSDSLKATLLRARAAVDRAEQAVLKLYEEAGLELPPKPKPKLKLIQGGAD